MNNGHSSGFKTGDTKIKDLNELEGLLDALRTEGRKVVHCHGVFDLLHIGHIRHFQKAKELGDVLVVTITQDKFVNKGDGRPAFTEQLRAEALAALDCIDFVCINQWPLSADTIRLLKPHVYVKGSDYKQSDDDHTGGILLEEEAIKSVGGEHARRWGSTNHLAVPLFLGLAWCVFLARPQKGGPPRPPPPPPTPRRPEASCGAPPPAPAPAPRRSADPRYPRRAGYRIRGCRTRRA